MAKIKPVTMFQTEDGETFRTEAKAQAHADECDLRDWYDKHMIHSEESGEYVSFETIMGWLKDNKTKVLEMLKANNPA